MTIKKSKDWFMMHIDLKFTFAKEKQTRPSKRAVTSLGVSGSKEVLSQVTVSLKVVVHIMIRPKIIAPIKIKPTHLFTWLNNHSKTFSLFVFLWIAKIRKIQINVIKSASKTLIHESFFAICNNGGIAKTWFFNPTAVIIRRIIWNTEIKLDLLIATAPNYYYFSPIFCWLIIFYSFGCRKKEVIHRGVPGTVLWITSYTRMNLASS